MLPSDTVGCKSVKNFAAPGRRIYWSTEALIDICRDVAGTNSINRSVDQYILTKLQPAVSQSVGGPASIDVQRFPVDIISFV